MKAGTLLLVVGDLINYLKDNKFILDDGSFKAPSLADDSMLAAAVEQILKNHGVSIEEHLDKVIKALPLIFSFFG
jgi:hypothetical protein